MENTVEQPKPEEAKTRSTEEEEILLQGENPEQQDMEMDEAAILGEIPWKQTKQPVKSPLTKNKRIKQDTLRTFHGNTLTRSQPKKHYNESIPPADQSTK